MRILVIIIKNSEEQVSDSHEYFFNSAIFLLRLRSLAEVNHGIGRSNQIEIWASYWRRRACSHRRGHAARGSWPEKRGSREARGTTKKAQRQTEAAEDWCVRQTSRPLRSHVHGSARGRISRCWGRQRGVWSSSCKEIGPREVACQVCQQTH